MNEQQPKVCGACGWADHGRYSPNECDPARGAAARALIAALPDVESSMLGWGFGHVTFGRDLDDPGFHVRLEALRDGSFDLSDVTCFDPLSRDDAADLVRTLLAWLSRRDARAKISGGDHG